VISGNQIGVSEPVPTLGPSDGAGFVDGAAQHRASITRRSGVRRIRFSSTHRSKRIEGRLKVKLWPDASGSHRFGLRTPIHRIQQRRHRIAWTPLVNGTVNQSWQVSTYGGATWKIIFDGTYTRSN